MATATASTPLRPLPSPPSPPRLAGSLRRWCWGIPVHSHRRAFHAHRRRRSALLCAAIKGPEESFKKTIEVDRLIDMLRDANPRELDVIVVENILAFSEGFWVRLAARIDLCKSDDDKKDYEELAENIMNIVDRVVHKTDEKIEQSTDVLKAIISPVMQEGEDVMWPPRDPEALKLMEMEISNREKEGQLDESFLSEVNAQLRQAKEDGDKPGLQAMLQKVLQLYACNFLQKRSYAYKGGEVVVPEKFLESIIQAPENDWNKLLLDGLTVGKGDVSPEELYTVTKKRIERILIRTEGGSYQQRVLVEYIKEIQARAEEIVNRLQGPAI
ncbi:uncharacterized protein LOC100840747 isoform X4 [Brachypodium distachyon]|uniref:Uncharacterized protein n=1 Tax=Brachypodium distachyon TaxID=15368 RepID=I1I558_BRADI|nr:uncharacterized protein LOC100840747 isoform X4 [Brachypodium distachyon]KQJ97330.1 hypothetical protein BRADI_3g30127v3 [Brachypodium distachyon]|eukprot:XP_003574146.1 uncharacterized protein LOC100840747 isoform X4 [Brachypodium distachyon]